MNERINKFLLQNQQYVQLSFSEISHFIANQLKVRKGSGDTETLEISLVSNMQTVY